MPTLTLKPVRHTAPICLDYEDHASVVRFEREMRVHRAHTEPFLLEVPLAIDGTFFVHGERGSRWLVDIVDGSRGNDCCNCPDYLTNELGTCKHLQAVHRAIESSTRLTAAHRRLPAVPETPTLTVDGRGIARILAVGRWTEASVARLGLRMGPRGVEPIESVDALAAPPGNVRIVHAALPVAQRWQLRKASSKRTAAVTRAFSKQGVALDVLRAPLFPYQLDGVTHLAKQGRALLADDMGLGKTVQAVAACELLRRRGEASRVLVVTPASLKDQWAREISRYTGERAIIVGGDGESRARAFESDAPYRIVNYELTWRELERIQALDADILVLDEAQRAKNFRSKTATTLRELPSRFLFVLTGTPVENRLDDLYALMQLVDPSLLGPLWRFNHEFHVQAKKGRVTSTKNLGELRTRLAPVLLRRRKEEVLSQLPALTEQTRYTAMTELQVRLEGEHRAEAAKLMSLAEKRALRPEELQRLMGHLLKARQACDAVELCDARRGKGSPKLDELEQLVSEIVEQGTAKILVFSEWVEMLALASARLDALGIRHEMLHGSIPTDKRPELLRRFREDADVRVLLSTDAGGVGLNLQEASYVVHLDLPWNPAKLDQRTSRAHRLGQTRGVSVTCLCAESGIERGIEGTLGAKRALRSAALDAESDVDGVTAVGFSVFLAQLNEAMEKLERARAEAPPAAEAVEVEVQAEEISVATESAAAIAATPTSETSAGQSPAAPGVDHVASGVTRSPARERLRFARVVLDAGFPADAASAAYEALASSLSAIALADEASGTRRAMDHGALVAMLYRDLVPRGLVPASVGSVLARLRDLTLLRAEGVALEASMAAEAVAEAEEWVGRMSTHPAMTTSSGPAPAASTAVLA